MDAKVIEIGELRIKRDQRREYERKDACKHFAFTLDTHGGIIECDDCGKQLSPYWALELLITQHERAWAKIDAAKQQHLAAKAQDLSLLAAQVVEKAWRSRKMAPACPHCNEAILSTDGFGRAQVNREIALARRAAKQPG